MENTFFDNKKNEEILQALKVELVGNNLRRYKSNWPRRVTRTNNNGIAKIMLKYGTNGRRRLGRPLKRLSDVAETGPSRSDSCRLMIAVMMMMMIRLFKTISS